MVGPTGPGVVGRGLGTTRQASPLGDDPVEVLDRDALQNGAHLRKINLAVRRRLMRVQSGLVAVLLVDDVCPRIGARSQQRIELAPGFVLTHRPAQLGKHRIEFLFVSGLHDNVLQSADRAERSLE